MLNRNVAIIAIVISVAKVQASQYCSMACNFGGSQKHIHTVCSRDKVRCGPAPNCGPDFREIKLTDKQRLLMVDVHNRLRNTVASGKERRNDQPSAANMMALRYNKELEYVAQCWGNTCQGKPLVHDACRSIQQHEHVGQNLAYLNTSTANINLEKAIEDLIVNWYDEVADFKSQWVPDTQDRGRVKVGHYTQLIWAETDQVGCSVTYYTTPNNFANFNQKPFVTYKSGVGKVLTIPSKPNKKWHHLILVCNYAPGGNYIGEPVYKSGTPCSSCPPTKRSSNRYTSLCE